ncbi:MAG TPA: helical backbone metal receptor [Niabella sp.]|nr:helical backbone metal receptor [Niabella sp.]HOZ98219.1 helical backbone metal receptor [Niabella sp.]HQW16260.1 helical backbone metal receptor [Niabella sp.]HQX21453.1 helical backbone metal receptor [Niabella sp.]HQX42728.1 helical backbone metal receptor [Niabella sp.]
MRIISLVPSITELLYALGLEHEVSGITKFCVHPKKWFQTKERIGGPKTLNIEKIQSLHPELVIAGKEENIKKQVEAIEQFCKVHLTDVVSFEDAIDMIEVIGTLTGKTKQAVEISGKIKLAFEQLKTSSPKKAVYFIWKDPWMVAGGDTFINAMMHKAGYINLFADQTRYPSPTLDRLIEMKPPYLLLSSEPYPFHQKHAQQLKSFFPESEIVLVDGEMFSWYGSRMINAADYFNTLS